MPTLRPMLVAAAILTMSCGSSDGTTTDPNANAGGGKTMTATFNGVAFTPNILTSGYLSGQVGVSASDGPRNLSIAGTGVNATGTYTFTPGNPNSLLATWVDGNGQFSTGTGGSGTITFTVLQLGRVAGSFNLTARNRDASGTPATVNVVATFDIKFP